MFRKMAPGLLLGMVVLTASAQSATDIQSKPDSSAYGADSRGAILRSGTGMCWRTGYWTPADAVDGCDGTLLPPIARPTAPDLVPATAGAALASLMPVVAPARRCDASFVVTSDSSFGFGNATLSGKGKSELVQRFRQRAARCSKLETIKITGHTDRIGDPKRNERLSASRADAIAAELKKAGTTTLIEIKGAGSSDPIVTCSDKLARKKLIACLAPNRRATIEVSGSGT